MTNNHWKAQFYQSALNTPLQKSLPTLLPLIESWDGVAQHADAAKWDKQLQALPKPENTNICIGDTVCVEGDKTLTEGAQKHLTSVLQQFMPWRKGPFEFFGVHIDTEWRSDWKWQRVLPYLSSLQGHRVLDVGCGSGYHLFRMYEAGATQVVGIDPTTLFFYQFQCVKRYCAQTNIHYLPVGIEQMPDTKAFDTVFSMGVLYHRPDPLAFLKQLKAQLNKDGQLLLETLVVEGDENTVFMPPKRYAQMRNVYFLPSIKAMIVWLEKVGFCDVSLVDDNVTTTDEQRATQWMTNQSLIDFLDPNDRTKTIEGYSAPRRATFVARTK
ncbi:tRNA 5-methoxyuridine(34)/uridine 5-oxyacetic acid(34) synthase CmoB [Glaciecola sp. XM2]|uniref:tRNA 5-methoxyuridine(34)/uridine 5-oxyacetic acid(34) synthase CmoB n=1 Tax=Glaciecola sp. XM2 TaxID=1914931 RepID=UPI001BDEC74A|nr:tRNA 5-methoxyuridine(34)/uridine 5-oxyacetic acid(34) synthase CmoB [Glaciecola sp. XM2]MBT1449574.1 tRNA 5-methoxyuridine(34)/uridine 5-oxyacetic acid(34) synthase CmoB [Glaciecola sp. XM2]